jgi:hypothetical protein
MDWFLISLAATAVVRGLGAGIIYDVALVSLPARRRIGLIPYAQYTRANYEVLGVKTYVTVSILGALLTVVVTVGAFVWQNSVAVICSTMTSLAATVLAFVGTACAMPVVLRLRQTINDEALLSKMLNRFARWHAFSAAWQVVAFVAMVAALATY